MSPLSQAAGLSQQTTYRFDKRLICYFPVSILRLSSFDLDAVKRTILPLTQKIFVVFAPDSDIRSYPRRRGDQQNDAVKELIAKIAKCPIARIAGIKGARRIEQRRRMVCFGRFHPRKTPGPLAELSHALGVRHQRNGNFFLS